jgi:hypothetical protein
MKRLFIASLIAALSVQSDEPNSIVVSSEDGILKTTTEIQQVIFVFTPGVSDPSTDIIVHDVMRFGTNVLKTTNVRVLNRDFPSVVASVPAITNAFAQFKMALPAILTNSP